MKDLGLTRQAIIRTQRHALNRLQYHLSSMGDTESSDLMRVGGEGEKLLEGRALDANEVDTLLSRICEMILVELGHEPEVSVADSNGQHQSQTTRAVRRMGGVGRGRKSLHGE